MATAYTGNGPYCYSNSLHMCLTQAGMAAVPPVGLLECMTGMPFGASFLALDVPLFFPSPGAGTNPDRGLTRALDTMGWDCTLRRFEDAGAAEAGLREGLAAGPVLLGPLDMGGLSYDPLHEHKRGGDHFVVALAREGDRRRIRSRCCHCPISCGPGAPGASAMPPRPTHYVVRSARGDRYRSRRC